MPKTEKIYNRDYFKKWYLRYYESRKQYFKNLIEKLKNYLPEKGKMLDIGCGVGIFMDIMKENGWDVYGQDISPFAVEYCEKKGYKVFKGNLSDIKISEKFDLITMLDVIAHIENPVSYIKICAKLLKPGGYLIIKTPYHPPSLFLLARFLSFTGKSKVFLHIPAQLFHFNENSIRTIFILEGFHLLTTIKIDDFMSSLRLTNLPYIMLKYLRGNKARLFVCKKGYN